MAPPGREPDLGPVAQTVRRYDPALFATALFAPEPGRGRLMVLYAADIELARAAHAARRPDAGPIISAMRLQWWRDVVAAAAEGRTPQHEIAGPLARLVAEGRLAARDLEAMAEGYAMEAEPLAEGTVDIWARARFAVRIRAAAQALEAEMPEEVAEAAGQAIGRAYLLRSAATLAREGRELLPGLSAQERADLAVGQASGRLPDRAARLATVGRSEARAARAVRPGPSRRAIAALLPLWQADLALAAVKADPARIATGVPEPSSARRAVALAWAALTGRW